MFTALLVGLVASLGVTISVTDRHSYATMAECLGRLETIRAAAKAMPVAVTITRADCRKRGMALPR